MLSFHTVLIDHASSRSLGLYLSRYLNNIYKESAYNVYPLIYFACQLPQHAKDIGDYNLWPPTPRSHQHASEHHPMSLKQEYEVSAASAASGISKCR